MHSANPSKLGAVRLAMLTKDLKERSAAAAAALNAALKSSAEQAAGDVQSLSLKIGLGENFTGSSGLSVRSRPIISARVIHRVRSFS